MYTCLRFETNHNVCGRAAKESNHHKCVHIFGMCTHLSTGGVYDTARVLSASYPRESLNGDRLANSVPGGGVRPCLLQAFLLSRRWFLS